LDEQKRNGFQMKTHGTGAPPWKFRSCGKDVILEAGVLVFHPENVTLGNDVYIGHYSILKGYHENEMVIGDGTWIGQQCFLHSAGGIVVGCDVGIGPGVKILTSQHDVKRDAHLPILHRPISFSAVRIGDGCDIGVSAVLLPGVELGERVQVAAGAVGTKSFFAKAVIAGVPAREIGAVE
jgi:acetyltransferase-like isoleucine patch superfamily enzyme